MKEEITPSLPTGYVLLPNGVTHHGDLVFHHGLGGWLPCAPGERSELMGTVCRPQIPPNLGHRNDVRDRTGIAEEAESASFFPLRFGWKLEMAFVFLIWLALAALVVWYTVWSTTRHG